MELVRHVAVPRLSSDGTALSNKYAGNQPGAFSCDGKQFQSRVASDRLAEYSFRLWSDNGPEFVAEAVQDWTAAVSTRIAYIKLVTSF
jgi:hypothetical protein